MERHGLIRLYVPQHTLHVQSHLAVLCGFRQQRTVKIAVNQPCKMVDAGLYLRQLVKAERIAHAHGGAGPLFLVGGEILIADGTGGLGLCPVQIRMNPGEALLDIGIRSVGLAENCGFCAASGSGKAGGHHSAAHFPALVAQIVNIVIQRNRPDHHDVVFLLHGKRTPFA